MPPSPIHEASAPPPSPIPQKPVGRARMYTDPAAGWRPAENDESSKAVAWRAARGMRIAEETRTELEVFSERLEKLTTIVQADIDSRNKWASRGRWAMTVFVGAILVLMAGALWRLAGRVRLADEPQDRPQLAAQVRP